ncbi:MAG: tetratricopeptide repeat protein, partial [Planctomycetes bacterium]|nr:tetratricopeptide repeat protein [Planctomycetota bacterium]
MSKERSFVRRGAVIIAIAVGAAAAVLFGTFWIQEAPLREAEALLEAGKAADALQAVESWEAEHGARGSSQALRARCLVELGRHAEAIAIFESVGAGQTEEIHAWARAWLHREQWAHALPLLEEVHR